MKNPITRRLDNAMGRLFEGPQPQASKYHTGGFVGSLTPASQPEHADIEKLIHDTVARWHGDQSDRRPLAKVLTETLRPYLKKPAGYRYVLSYELADNPGYEYEDYVDGIAEARTHLRGKTDMLVWATLTDQDGNEVCSSEKLR